MISYLRGKIFHKDTKSATLDVNGVGYEVFAPARTLSSLVVGSGAVFFIYMSVRETALELYGFVSIDERELFKKLIRISGIGPKTALGILNAVSPDEIEQAVATQQVNLLIVKGVGRKTEEKILLALKGKLVRESSLSEGGGYSDLVAALLRLGYKSTHIQQVLEKIPKNASSIEEQLKSALKFLA